MSFFVFIVPVPARFVKKGGGVLPKNDPVNYYKEMESVIASLGGARPRLLLHSCCGPCSSAVLELVTAFFDVTVFYYNPNIGSGGRNTCWNGPPLPKTWG